MVEIKTYVLDPNCSTDIQSIVERNYLKVLINKNIFVWNT